MVKGEVRQWAVQGKNCRGVARAVGQICYAGVGVGSPLMFSDSRRFVEDCWLS
jgi:hypothetical protein